MPKRNSSKVPPRLGEWSFVVGILLAIVLGFFPSANSYTTALILMLLGAIVGLLNITAKETTGYLLASLSLIIGSATIGSILNTFPGAWSGVFIGLSTMLANIEYLIAPAAIIVALKTIFQLARSK